MNQNRRKQRPQNHSGILLVVPQPVGSARLQQTQCQPSSWSNDRLVKEHLGVEALLRLGTVSQATGADNLARLEALRRALVMRPREHGLCTFALQDTKLKDLGATRSQHASRYAPDSRVLSIPSGGSAVANLATTRPRA